MKKVLIITYYWPPIGGAGVQRWLKFTKYLRDSGWEPVIYTPENPELFSIDSSLEKDIPANLTVLKTKIREPYSLYRMFTGKKKEEKVNPGFISTSGKPGLAGKISVWIRGNLFIPDARKYWIKPSVTYLSSWLKKNKADVMISTGPPHSMHLIALGLKKKLGIPWLADFRDPWTGIDFYNQLMLTSFADKKHRRLEKQVLQHADKIITVGWKLAEELQELSGENIEVITNGYDEDDFSSESVPLSPEFSITHAGAMNRDRNPDIFWQALAESLNEVPGMKEKLQIRLIGKTDYHVLESLRKNGLDKFLLQKKYLPHNEAVREMRSSQVLLLPLNNTPNVLGIVTGKLFEYLAAKRPILLIGPAESDSARILQSCSAGKICGFSEKEKMKEAIRDYFHRFNAGTLSLPDKNIAAFSRKNLAVKLAALLDQMKI